MAAAGIYPVKVDAALDPPLSRWLWLVKWVLVIPHAVVLAFLWLAFAVLSVVAFFAILFTGRYPRAIFEFNVGVLRWSWRVQYYAIGAFGTDRYPPFTLADDPAYPAHLEVEYPQRLSRGLVLVKWWLLAIPHYLIVGLFTGTGAWYAWRFGAVALRWEGIGLIGILALIAAVFLLVTGRYPEQIFDFVLGMNRWVLRVAGYAGLMTDEYPPFRLDMGGHEPGGTLTLPPHQPPQDSRTAAVPEQTRQPEPPGTGTGQAPGASARGWTAGRIVSVTIGAVLALISLGALSAGGTAVWADTQRDAGYVNFGTVSYATASHALASETISIHDGWGWFEEAIGRVRIQVTGTGHNSGIFAGIAPAGAVSRYLSGVAYTTVTGTNGHQERIVHPGSVTPQRPGSVPIWAVQASGPRAATLLWTVRNGDWTVVVMNTDGSAGVTASARLGASLPALGGIAAGLLAGGAVLMLAALACIIVPIRRASAAHA